MLPYRGLVAGAGSPGILSQLLISGSPCICLEHMVLSVLSLNEGLRGPTAPQWFPSMLTVPMQLMMTLSRFPKPLGYACRSGVLPCLQECMQVTSLHCVCMRTTGFYRMTYRKAFEGALLCLEYLLNSVSQPKKKSHVKGLFCDGVLWRHI